MWRSHANEASYSEDENRQLGDVVNEAGGQVLLDQRVRRVGSKHQKFVVLRRPGDPAGHVAFAGGIDLSHSRRDDRHPRDPWGLGDGARTFARELRLELVREHLDLAADGREDAAILDVDDLVRTLDTAADALDAWHNGGKRGPDPAAGCAATVPRSCPDAPGSGAKPVYRLVYDPDGRPWRARPFNRW